MTNGFPAQAWRASSLAQVCAPWIARLSRLLAENRTLEADTGRAALDRALLQHLPSSLPADGPVVVIVDRLIRSETSPLVAQLARELGLSSRQLQRRFRAAVGVPLEAPQTGSRQ